MKTSNEERIPGDVVAGVLRIASHVLRSERCSSEDDFFELGGTSLAALQIIGLIRQEYGVDISLTDFFDAPDLGTFAELVRDAR